MTTPDLRCDDDELVHHQDEAPIDISTAFQCARCGIIYAFRTQRNFKIHTVFALLAIVLAALFQIDLGSWLAILLCIVMVYALEMLNTAVEAVVDLVSPGWNELAKRAKDCAAGAVYIAAIGSLFVAAFIFIPRIADLVALLIQGR